MKVTSHDARDYSVVVFEPEHTSRVPYQMVLDPGRAPRIEEHLGKAIREEEAIIAAEAHGAGFGAGYTVGATKTLVAALSDVDALNKCHEAAVDGLKAEYVARIDKLQGERAAEVDHLLAKVSDLHEIIEDCQQTIRGLRVVHAKEIASRDATIAELRQSAASSADLPSWLVTDEHGEEHEHRGNLTISSDRLLIIRPGSDVRLPQTVAEYADGGWTRYVRADKAALVAGAAQAEVGHGASGATINYTWSGVLP